MRLRKNDGPEEDFQMAPMIDMVFLLLVFFMCVSTMAQAERKEVELPHSKESAVAEDLSGRGVVTVDADGQAYVAAKAVSHAELKELLRAAAEADATFRVQIRADRDTPFSHLRPVLKVCAEAGAHEVIYATVEAR